MSALPADHPPSYNIHASRQPQLYAASIITYALAVVAVGLRLWCRKLLKSGFRLDDWLIVAALAIATGFLVSTLVWISQGYGLHYEVLNPNVFVTHFFKNLFVGEILYLTVICLVKYSILAFYWRLFARSIRVPVQILAGVTTLWGLSVLFITIFQCTPVEGFWNRELEPDCKIDDYAFFLGNCVPNILTDTAIVALPLPYVWKLNRSRSQKTAIAAMFGTGGLVIIISILRLVTLVNTDLKSPDIDWNFAYVGIWTETESNMAIFAACLPSLRPLLSLILTGSPNPSHNYASGSSPKKDRKASYGPRRFGNISSHTESKSRFVQLSGPESVHGGQEGYEMSRSTVASGGNAEPAGKISQVATEDVTKNGINVRNEVEVGWNHV